MRTWTRTWTWRYGTLALAAAAGGCGLVGYGDDGDPTAPACYQAIAVGEDHTCAVNRAGKVYCWGANDHGQLIGGGPGAPQASPVVVTLPSAALDVAAGKGTTCAITDDQQLWCWGAQPGPAIPPVDYGPPTAIDLGGPVYRVGIGERFACAKVGPDDHVACWGIGDQQRLGQPDSNPHPAPVTVSGPIALAALSVGQRGACALGGDGTVWCWGDNRSGQLGLGVGDVSAGPTVVTALAHSDRIGIGDRIACATGDDGVRCWGGNDLGQLGGGTVGGMRAQPEAPLFGPVDDLVTMSNGACLLDWDGAVRCWGQNRAGQLGDADLAVRTAPTELVAMQGARSLAGGYQQACAEKGDQLWCWGDNLVGQLGRGSVAQAPSPRRIAAGTTFASVRGAGATLCAVDTSQNLWCWGDGERFQTGLGVQAGADVPTMVMASVKDVAVGGLESCARDDSTVRCWGRGATTPQALLNDNNLAVGVGDTHGCVLLTSELRCWGDNDRGQVGDGTHTPVPAPIKIHFDAPPIALALGSQHTCILDGLSALWCWGVGTDGQLGNGEAGDLDHPVPIAHPTVGHTFTKLAAGRAHTCAIDDLNDLWCWGANGVGQLGSSPGPSLVPRKVEWPQAAGAVKDVFVRFDSTCAILMSGEAKCWGADGWGALGGVSGPIPRAFGGVADIASFGGGEASLCAVTTAGELWCAGAGNRGQLGGDFLGWTPATVPVPCE